MADARMLEMTDDYAEFSTMPQAAAPGRLSIPNWLCKFYRVWSPDPIKLRVETRAGAFEGDVHLTSGTEIVQGRDTELHRLLRPGVRVKVRVYNPKKAAAGE